MKALYFEKADGFRKVIEKLNELAIADSNVFRGINKFDEMSPQLIRNRDYRKYEKKLLYDFDHYGRGFMNASGPIDFMSYAQHFGLPTRLLDFTYNPFIALAFSLHNKKQAYKNSLESEYYTVMYASIRENIYTQNDPIPDALYPRGPDEADSLAKRTWEMISVVEGVFSSSDRKELIDLGIVVDEKDVKEGSNKIKDKKLLFIDPNQSNQRIIMQQGLFMFPYSLDKNQHEEIIRNNTALIHIHKDLRRPLLEYLDKLGMNNYRLMPDLGNVCSEIKRRVITERIDSKEEGVGMSKYQKQTIMWRSS